MAIKAGQILHDVNGYVVDRIQSAGPGNLNIPQEKIYELGNYQTVATIYDIPDLSFDLESFDMSTEFEWLVCNGYVTDDGGATYAHTALASITAGDRFDFDKAVPIDVISPFKSRKGAFDIVKGVAVPYLTLERANYRFGLRQNASQQFTFKGDSIYYTPDAPYYQEETHSGAGPYSLDLDTTKFEEGSNDIYCLCVVVVNNTTNEYKRCFYTSDSPTSGYYYTDNGTGTNTTVTLLGDATDTDWDVVRFVYAVKSTESVSYDPGALGTGNNPSGNEIHEGVSVKPAAIRPKDINVYIGSGATMVWTRLTGVQSVEASWSVNLENDEEFGNAHYVAQEYDTADVTGTIGFKPTDPADLMAKLYYITTGSDDGNVIGPNLSTPVEMEIVISHPTTGATLKTIYIPDARFQVPGISGRVQQKLETTLNYNSDGGLMYVYNGDSGNR